MDLEAVTWPLCCYLLDTGLSVLLTCNTACMEILSVETKETGRRRKGDS